VETEDVPERELYVTSRAGEVHAFRTVSALADWVRGEADHWKAFQDVGQLDSSDSDSALGAVGALEFYAEWLAFAQQAESIEQFELAEALAAAISERLRSRSIVTSSSRIGRNLLSLAERDPGAAAVAVSLFTGRNISRVIAPQNAKPLWRSVVRMFFGASLDGELNGVEARVSIALRAAELNAAEISSKERELSGVLERARGEFVQQAEKGRVEADALIAEIRRFAEAEIAKLTAMNGEEVTRIASEWADLKSTYETKFALKAPRSYWHKRRVTHRILAAVWGVAVGLVAYVSVAKLVPSGATLLAEARAGGGNISLMHVVPEMFQIAVIAFLVLWGLRFGTRQVAENLMRLEEASQRVTMVDTFLAFTSPGDGQSAVVGDADRAVIVQALFRPSAHSQVDDAPPVHWIEDVFRRIKSSGAEK
jgi:hypothetical protein